ncbi:MAG: hypothetical protein ABJN62_18705 [Halioglobus sp.]
MKAGTYQAGTTGNHKGRAKGAVCPKRKEERDKLRKIARTKGTISRMGTIANDPNHPDHFNALKWINDRVVAPLKSVSAPIDIAQGRDVASMLDALPMALDAVLNGRMSPTVFAELMQGFSSYAELSELAEIKDAIAELQEEAAQRHTAGLPSVIGRGHG